MSEGTRIEARPGETPNEPAADAAANPAEPEKKKRGRASLPKHPGITETTRLEEVPKDFSPKIHAALKEEDFSDNHLDKFYDH